MGQKGHSLFGTSRRSAIAIAWLAIAVLLVGCTPAEEPAPEETTTPAATAAESETTAPSESTVPTPSPTTAPSPTEGARPLDDEWYVDTDDDSVPDFIEESAGYDPEVDDCAREIDCPGPAGLSPQSLTRDQNTLLMLDSSGSMAASGGGGRTKMEAARDALERYATGTPDFVNLGFLVYGHKGSNEPSGKAESCRGVEVLAPLGKVKYKTFPKVLASFEPTGYTPIAGALEEAADVFAGTEKAVNRVIMVSDGIETCDGDPVAAARQLARAGIAVTVDVVGFGVEDTDAEQLRAIAKATGGTYTDAPTGDALEAYFQDEYERLAALTEQYGCVVRQLNGYLDCAGQYLVAVQDTMSRLINEATDPEEIDAMIAIRAHASNELIAARDNFTAQTRQQQKRILDAMRKVRKRLRRRYGEELAMQFDCPADGLKVAVLERA